MADRCPPYAACAVLDIDGAERARQRVLGPGGGNANAAAVREPIQQREPLQSVARLFRWLWMLDINLPLPPRAERGKLLST